MDDYPIGYGKPPVASRFKPGQSGNPKGRPRRKLRSVPDLIDRSLNAPMKYHENGRAKTASREEVALMALIANALKGDIGAADHLLKVYADAHRFGDFGVGTIQIENWLPDHGEQTAEQKAQTHSDTQPSDHPVEWWNDPTNGKSKPD